MEVLIEQAVTRAAAADRRLASSRATEDGCVVDLVLRRMGLGIDRTLSFPWEAHLIHEGDDWPRSPRFFKFVPELVCRLEFALT